nr:glycosyltransferase family 4 protein [Galbitalea soli]
MGVDVERFDVGERPPLDALRVLFVGRLVEEKGPLDVVEAIILLHRRGVPIEARFVGSGPQREEIERRVRAAGIGDAVRVLGWVSSDDVVEQYRWATAFVGPSVQTASGWVEALGVVFIEASAARLPVITTRAGGTTDIVRDRETGLIVDEGSPAEIADRLAELLARPEFAMRLGEAARAHVRANFAWPPIAHRYAQLFSELDPR